MWGVRVGVDSLTKYTKRRPRDSNALCQLALLQERVGLLRNALDNLQLASEILENAKAKRDENKLKKANEIKKEKKEKKEKKSAADRREELLKQLKAVENAIAKKRTKLSSKD